MWWVCDSREEVSGPFPPSGPALARQQGTGLAHSFFSCNCCVENPILGNSYFMFLA